MRLRCGTPVIFAYSYAILNFTASVVQSKTAPPLQERRISRTGGVSGPTHKETANGNDPDWILEEEIIKTDPKPSKHSEKTNVGSVEQWWRITSSHDPALDAEPALWDGDGLLSTFSSHLFEEYYLIQDKWEEHDIK